jgi:hypothetical protein
MVITHQESEGGMEEEDWRGHGPKKGRSAKEEEENIHKFGTTF